LVAAVLVIAAVALVAGAVAPSGPGPQPAAALSAQSVAPGGAAPAARQAAIYGESAGGAEVRRHLERHPAEAVPEVAPLPVAAFRRPIAAYRAYAGRQAEAMAAPAARLTAALRRGDRAAARAAWAAAYRRYLLLGAAYGALGELDDAIDGTPGGLPGGVRSASFTGLHRVEHDLWTGRPTRSIVPVARRLERDVAVLPRRVRTVELTPLDYATRAHEILEDAQRDFLSGRAAPWSGAGVAATVAALDATDEVLRTLRPLLRGRGSVLDAVDLRLGELRGVLGDLRRDHGGTPVLDALGRAERARLNGALGAALEALGGVPGDLETTLPPDVPAIPKGVR
jgi:high-affinity iron transporter